MTFLPYDCMCGWFCYVRLERKAVHSIDRMLILYYVYLYIKVITVLVLSSGVLTGIYHFLVESLFPFYV